jgi:hypothetical protein
MRGPNLAKASALQAWSAASIFSQTRSKVRHLIHFGFFTVVPELCLKFVGLAVNAIHYRLCLARMR